MKKQNNDQTTNHPPLDGADRSPVFSDTPRTDDFCKSLKGGNWGKWQKTASFAAGLERENENMRHALVEILSQTGAVAQERFVSKSSFVVMKIIQGWHEQWDVHCVCEDRKTAKAECDLRNSKAISNRYFVKRVPFIANVRPLTPADTQTPTTQENV